MTAIEQVEPAELSLTRLRWWDLDEVLALETVLFEQPWSREQFLSELAHVPESRHYLAAWDDCGLAGYAGLRVVPPEADVQTLAVAPRAQGRGVGRVLLDALLAEARGCGAQDVFLDVRADNDPARVLYASRGFVPVAERAGYYGAVDAVVMQLHLEQAR